jgi:hypothetical protein
MNIADDDRKQMFCVLNARVFSGGALGMRFILKSLNPSIWTQPIQNLADFVVCC